MKLGLFNQGLTKELVTSLATLTTSAIAYQTTYAQGTTPNPITRGNGQ